MAIEQTSAQAYVTDPRNEKVLVYVNGALVPRNEARVSVFDSGFSLGDGVWEGLRLAKGRLISLDAHMDRLFEGARSIDEGFVSAARLLGASEWQITRTVVIPSAMAWVFASLSPAISFALIGVIVGPVPAKMITRRISPMRPRNHELAAETREVNAAHNAIAYAPRWASLHCG